MSIPQDSHPSSHGYFAPHCWGVLLSKSQQDRVLDHALHQAVPLLPLPRLDVNAKAKYNPRTRSRC